MATPGRLLDFVKQGKIGFHQVRFLVLDEADRWDFTYVTLVIPDFTDITLVLQDLSNVTCNSGLY